MRKIWVQLTNEGAPWACLVEDYTNFRCLIERGQWAWVQKFATEERFRVNGGRVVAYGPADQPISERKTYSGGLAHGL